ncbi:OmpH family outer membrane protein [Zobellella aerophila]|uniref:OmpH family outer membrane protein n=1 Tax=Zobellella aerophila TaxID=870480 RepID=A0ABP6VL10_9GAMM
MKQMVKIFGVIALMLAAGLAQAQNVKIAVVDTAAVFQKMPQREATMNQLKKEFEGRVRDVQKLEADGRSYIEKQQKDMAFMNEEQKAQAQRKLNEMQSEYVQKRRSLEEDQMRREHEERQKMLGRIKAAIDEITKAEGYQLVLERSAAIYVSPALDITSQVISRVSK